MTEQSTTKQELFANLPAVDQLLQQQEIQNLCTLHPDKYVSNCIRKAIDEVRQEIIAGSITKIEYIPTIDDIICRIEELVQQGLGHKLMHAINGAGVILHTGLGRAPLALLAQASLAKAVSRYCILATERETGKRGDRNRHTSEMLRELTGAEDSLIVNNNSAAVMLTLNTFGNGCEAIVSRGELVEIGGAFRIPDVMARSGNIMVEVGTTNKTHLRDYKGAITEDTTILLKVHTSNYRIEGFHQEVSIGELSTLAKENNLILLHDIGSGAMVDLRRWGLEYEPTVPEAIADGADVVTFSGDKLLGGPQCGVIVGRKEYIDRMKRNPLMRAFRCDKLTISALDGTLKLFLDPDKLPETHPIYSMMTTPIDIVNRRARRIARRIRDVAGEFLTVKVEDGVTEMGSGSLPARPIPSRVISIVAQDLTAERLSLSLRFSDPPLFTRIEQERVIIDARTIADQEVKLFTRIFSRCIELKDTNKWSNQPPSTELDKTKRGDDLPSIG